MLPSDPFHAGEHKAQMLAGVPDTSEWAANFIRPSMPDQHRTFFTQLPFLVMAGADAKGRHWITMIEGDPGFVNSPDAKTLTVDGSLSEQDPLAATFAKGSEVGLLGIELDSRRRNRLSGTLHPSVSGYVINVSQSFGNCPQYIQKRFWKRVSTEKKQPACNTDRLNERQIALIETADTLFLGTGQTAERAVASNGFDASHRGGTPGFVQVIDVTHLRIPDYAGNNYFNTIGNLLQNPAIGLVFVDFETGGLLHLSGRAVVNWDASESKDPDALRMIDIEIDSVLDRPGALSLQWSSNDVALQNLFVTRKVIESQDILSLHLADATGAPLNHFNAGQHLPIELDIPGHTRRIKRTYSLSGSQKANTYRLSIKREPHGAVSQFLHDTVEVGDQISAHPPAGEFGIPDGNAPLVLVSAGVGQTPMLSILHAVLSQNAERRVWYVHGARNGLHHAFKAEVNRLVAARSNVTTCIMYSQPTDKDRLGVDYDIGGRIGAQDLLELIDGSEAHYLLCGPAKWIATLRADLESAKVAPNRIHYEVFGPASRASF